MKLLSQDVNAGLGIINSELIHSTEHQILIQLEEQIGRERVKWRDDKPKSVIDRVYLVPACCWAMGEVDYCCWMWSIHSSVTILLD